MHEYKEKHCCATLCTWWGKTKTRILAPSAAFLTSGSATIFCESLIPGKYLFRHKTCVDQAWHFDLLYVLMLLIDDISQITTVNLLLKDPHAHSGIKYIRVLLDILSNDTCNSGSPTTHHVKRSSHGTLLSLPIARADYWYFELFAHEKKARKRVEWYDFFRFGEFSIFRSFPPCCVT